jgi:hypothetical protein
VPKKNECLNLLRMPEAEQLLVLQDMETACQTQGWAEVRQNRRYRYFVRGGLLLRPRGSLIDFRVRPRNISAGGLSALHGAFIYPGTACEVVLCKRDGAAVSVAGLVVRCRCVSGKVHELNIKFTQSVEVNEFIAVDEPVSDPPTATDAIPAAAALAAPRPNMAALAQKLEQLAASDATRAVLVAALRKVAALLRNQAGTS